VARRRLASALALLLAALAAWLLLRDARPAAPLLPGAGAPDFTLPSLADGEVSLRALRGRVVLLNFWATWCKPCEDEMPAMERLHRSLEGRPFELLAISVDAGREEVVAFRERLGLRFPILLDPRKRVAGAYQSFRFPESWLVDAEGHLVERYVGPREWDAPEYRDRILRLLPGGPAASASSRAPLRAPGARDTLAAGGREP
jgi:peroxiredoxin